MVKGELDLGLGFDCEKDIIGIEESYTDWVSFVSEPSQPFSDPVPLPRPYEVRIELWYPLRESGDEPPLKICAAVACATAETTELFDAPEPLTPLMRPSLRSESSPCKKLLSLLWATNGNAVALWSKKSFAC